MYLNIYKIIFINIYVFLFNQAAFSSDRFNSYQDKIKTQYAYIVNSGNNTISRCVLKIDGGFEKCIPNAVLFNVPIDINVQENLIAYVTTKNNGIKACPLNSSDLITNCYKISLYNDVFKITFYKGFVYLARMDANVVTSCFVNANGHFENCKDIINVLSPTSIQFFNGHAYVMSNSNLLKIYQTHIDGTITYKEKIQFIGSHIHNFLYINNGFLYLSDDKRVYFCSLHSEIMPKNCKSTGYDNNLVWTMSIHNRTAYMANVKSNDISICDIKRDGSFYNCEKSPQWFYMPREIIFYTFENE